MSSTHKYDKWYGKEINGRFEWYEGLESNPVEVFQDLFKGNDVPTTEIKPEKMPDLRESIIAFGHSQLRKSLGEDWKLVKIINVYLSMDELINTLYEKSLALSLITGNHGSKEQFFRDLMEQDEEGMVKIGTLGMNMSQKKNELWSDIESRIIQILPGSSYLAGTETVAELLAHFGNLERLAMSRSSSIQMAGAEKSLFISKIKKVKNPKYGLIYKSPLVSSATPSTRGKVARKLAGKLAICLRADFSGNPIRKEEIDKMKEKIVQA
ncbi:hypothetical protein ACNF42_04670 [Cuniculiplasma sp. SKW3]|uniref:hypothetical protein n=1 Tax=Cuniculiplasma sp. SKW3 TaxID=3400170 RepID=UPI003FCF8B8C